MSSTFTKDTLFSDSWFSGCKTLERAISERVYYYGPFKMIHKEFFQAILEILVEEWPGRSYHIMRINPRALGDQPLMNIGYKYKYWKVLGFIAT